MIRLCVFDCDGTLVDSQASIVSAMTAVFRDQGLTPPSAEAVRRVVGLSLSEAIAELFPEGDRSDHMELARAYSDSFAIQRRSGTVNEPLYPGAMESLQALEDAGWILGMATGKSRRGALATLAGHGLDGRFVTLQTADTAAGKPSPDMMLRAMSETGTAPEATVMVGDTTFDMMMAGAADAWAVGVTWGYHGEDELIESGAHAIVHQFEHLLLTLEILCGSDAGATPLATGN
ncbi:MAG: HAD-IA family hydrolase [Rhodospirillales bacterium]|nr:HAD-IA family hydrolase [Rhodospirillales bacterium]